MYVIMFVNVLMLLSLTVFNQVSGTCLPGEFECYNGNCISQDLVNNSRNNCGDNSEEGSPFTCPRNESFKCYEGRPPEYTSGLCIAIRYIKDNIIDCPDKADEWMFIGDTCYEPSNPNKIWKLSCSSVDGGIGPGAICDPSNHICVCSSGWMTDTYGTKCTIRKLYDPCTTDPDCYDAFSGSECTSGGFCACVSGWYTSDTNDTCIRRRLGDVCTTDMECYDSVDDSFCGNNICYCNSGYVQTSFYKCTRRKVGDPCSTQSDCVDAMSESSCNEDGVCECNYYYTPWEDNSDCRVRKVGDECLNSEQCQYGISDALCSASRCRCIDGFLAIDDDTACRLRTIGDTCDVQLDCGAAVVDSNCTSGKCFCRPGYQAIGGDTECEKRILNDLCELDTDCSFAVANSHCAKLEFLPFKVCQCSQGYYSSDSLTVCLARKVGDECSVNEYCDKSLPNSECFLGKCKCQQGYVPRSGGAQCVGLKVGDSCNTTFQCETSLGKALCTNRVCVCAEDYFASFSLTACNPRMIGDDCERTTNCSDYIAHSLCLNGSCACVPGFGPDVTGTICLFGEDGNATDPSSQPSQGGDCESFICAMPWALAIIAVVVIAGIIAIIVGVAVWKKKHASPLSARGVPPEIAYGEKAGERRGSWAVRSKSSVGIHRQMDQETDITDLDSPEGLVFRSGSGVLGKPPLKPPTYNPNHIPPIHYPQRNTRAYILPPVVTGSRDKRGSNSSSFGSRDHRGSFESRDRSASIGSSRATSGNSRGVSGYRSRGVADLPSVMVTEESIAVDDYSDGSLSPDIPDLIPNGAPRASTAFQRHRPSFARSGSIIDTGPRTIQVREKTSFY